MRVGDLVKKRFYNQRRKNRNRYKMIIRIGDEISTDYSGTREHCILYFQDGSKGFPDFYELIKNESKAR